MQYGCFMFENNVFRHKKIADCTFCNRRSFVRSLFFNLCSKIYLYSSQLLILISSTPMLQNAVMNAEARRALVNNGML